ncbi:serine/threonine-protein kinase [archaeon]|nr:MAG: serine/threonine-protein kinase [archaeon]
MGQQLSSKISSETATLHHTSKDTGKSASTESSNSLESSSSESNFHSHYIIDGLLGHGSSANVYKVHHKLTGRSYAAKEVNLDGRMNTSDSMRTELEILQTLRHPHVVNLQESFSTSQQLWLVLEEVEGGDLVQACGSLPQYSERDVARIFRQILLGMQYLHERDVVHRDLKMENILVEGRRDNSEQPKSSDLIVKITDFGLAAKLKKRLSKRSKALKEMWGTTEYFAPEVYLKAYGGQADVWSLGCVLFEMLTGQLAFPHREISLPAFDRLMFYGLSKPQRPFELKKEWAGLSAGARDLIKKMLKRNPMRRFDVADCLKHPWIAQLEQNSSEELLGVQKVFRNRAERRALRNKKHMDKLLAQQKLAESVIA